jgi:hypothetical protein
MVFLCFTFEKPFKKMVLSGFSGLAWICDLWSSRLQAPQALQDHGKPLKPLKTIILNCFSNVKHRKTIKTNLLQWFPIFIYQIHEYMK